MVSSLLESQTNILLKCLVIWSSKKRINHHVFFFWSISSRSKLTAIFAVISNHKEQLRRGPNNHVVLNSRINFSLSNMHIKDVLKQNFTPRILVPRSWDSRCLGLLRMETQRIWFMVTRITCIASITHWNVTTTYLMNYEY